MKVKLVLLFMCISASTFAQESIEYQKVISVDSTSKNVLYSNLKQWFVDVYEVNENRLSLDDKETGVLILKTKFAYDNGKGLAYMRWNGPVTYWLKIETRDSRFRVSLFDFEHPELGRLTNKEIHSHKGMNKKYHNRFWVDVKVKAEEHSEVIFNHLNDYIKNVKKRNQDDW